MFDPQAVQEHLLFDVVGLNGKSIIEYLKVSPNKKKEEMADTKSELRKARVEQLTGLYEQRIMSEVSPFEDGSANLDSFLERF